MPQNTDPTTPRQAAPLKRRRGKFLAGVFGLTLMGLVTGQLIITDSLPVFAQEAPPADQNQQNQQDQPPPSDEQRRRDEERAREEQRARDEQRNQAPITVQRPANAPSSFAPIVTQVRPAVVSVRVENGGDEDRGRGRGFDPFDLPEDHPLYRWFRRFGEDRQQRDTQPRRRGPGGFGQSQGSGFFISADGYVVTNNHVVERGDRVEVVTDDGKTHRARVVGVDDRTDLAVLKVDADRAFPYVRFSKANPEVGDWVVAIGNPFGLGGTVTAGIVSARGRDINAGAYDDFIQIDAPINRGNSGGPAFNLDGEVIGINTAIYSPSGGSVGIGFAIPSEVAERVVTELRENGEVTRGWLGVAIQGVTDDVASSLNLPNTKGALVSEPQSDGPAVKAGIRSRDVIVSVNGQEVETARDLSRRIAALDPGSKVEIVYLRNGRRETVSVELGRLPAEQRRSDSGDNNNRDDDRDDRRSDVPSRELDDLGLVLEPSRDGRGVAIAEVERNSTAEEKGLRSGDVILEVGDREVSSTRAVADAIRDAERDGRKAVMFRVKSGDSSRLVALALKAS